MELWKLFLAAGGIAGISGFLTAVSTRVNAREANQIAARRLEEEMDDKREARLEQGRKELMEQKDELHREHIHLLEKQLGEAVTRAEVAEKALAGVRETYERADNPGRTAKSSGEPPHH